MRLNSAADTAPWQSTSSIAKAGGNPVGLLHNGDWWYRTLKTWNNSLMKVGWFLFPTSKNALVKLGWILSPPLQKCSDETRMNFMDRFYSKTSKIGHVETGMDSIPTPPKMLGRKWDGFYDENEMDIIPTSPKQSQRPRLRSSGRPRSSSAKAK